MMYSENEQKHLNHQFYHDVQDYRETVRIGQILKGSQKYPEPFTTVSWSCEEIAAHAMQENVDQAHYIYAALERMQQLEKDLREAEQLVKWQNQQLLKSKATIRELRARDRVSRYLKVEEENLKLSQENKRLKEKLAK